MKLNRKSITAEKKRHTLKSLVISDFNRRILFLCRIVAGSVHDYTLMKDVFTPGSAWFEKVNLWLDLGFLGADKDYQSTQIYLPHKKPRKSKKNPNPTLTPEQKKQNRKQAATRVIVEHAIGGMKFFHCLVVGLSSLYTTMYNYFLA
nr:transposase family protein [Methylocaldum marinum]